MPEYDCNHHLHRVQIVLLEYSWVGTGERPTITVGCAQQGVDGLYSPCRRLSAGHLEQTYFGRGRGVAAWPSLFGPEGASGAE